MKRIYPNGICVYIAPLKSLARERLKDWKARFGKSSLGWQVLELSGDTHHDQSALQRADILVCTPEKWYVVIMSLLLVRRRIVSNLTFAALFFRYASGI